MQPRSTLAPITLSLALILTACGGGDAKKTEAKKTETKAAETPAAPAEDTKRDPGTSLDKAATTIDTSGPVPPEASAVFYTVDGALIPLGCYLHDKKKLGSGKDCLKAVQQGDEVLLKSNTSETLDKIGAPKAAMCEGPASGAPTSLSAPAVDAGATYDFAVAPKAFARQVVLLSEESWSEKKPGLSADETAALTALAKVQGELTIAQVALQDLDGDTVPEKIVSVAQVNPKDSERYNFSGVFVQRGTAPGTWIPIETKSNDTETFRVRAALDLDGDRSHELWLNSVTTEGGGGDRIYQLTQTGATGLGKWTCGL
ncbi:MAG TPA: hypothetical protein VGB85_08810 [Nannocystis sp.]|jgi:hypothetical protein